MSAPDRSEPGGSPSVRVSVTVPYRVRFDECAPDGLVRTSTLLRYAQDAAWVHAEELGINRDWSRAHGLTWLVRAAEVAVLRPIPVGVVVDVTTRLGGARRVLARRRTEVRLPDGVLASWGHTDWVVIDERGQPARLPADFLARFETVGSGFEPLRLPSGPEPADATPVPFAVRPQDLDPLAHVNNATYVDYLEEAVADVGDRGATAVSAVPRTVRLEYRFPAGPGMRLRGVAWAEHPDAGRPGGSWLWRLTGDDDQELARGRLTTTAQEAP